MKDIKNNRGITLIALIIIIVIVLLLAGISINALKANGLFFKTKNAKEESERLDAEKVLNEVASEWKIQKMTNTSENIEEFLNRKMSENQIDSFSEEENSHYKLYRNGYSIMIDSDGELVDKISKSPEKAKKHWIIDPEAEDDYNTTHGSHSKWEKENIKDDEHVVDEEAQGKYVKYDAGDWTEEEIKQLKNKHLYMVNKEKITNATFNLDNDTGLNFTFGGFTYKDDTANADSISNGTLVTSKNESAKPMDWMNNQKVFKGWKILECETRDGKTYVTKIIHAGTPENFVFQSIVDNGYRAEYLLSGGIRQTKYSTLPDTGTTINPRNYDNYKDQSQLNLIKEIHCMTNDELTSLTGDTDLIKNLKVINVPYWVATSYYNNNLYDITNAGTEMYGSFDIGIRPVVAMVDGVYLKSGNGTEESPYVLAVE